MPILPVVFVLVLLVASVVPAECYAGVVSILFTLAHTGEEVLGRGGPFWWYFRERFGFGALGCLTGLGLFAGLAAILIVLAVGGYFRGSALLLGGLLGARTADALVSHAGLRVWFKGPNPGLWTSPLYLIEVGVGLLLFPVSPLGFALGAGAFVSFWSVSFAVKAIRGTHAQNLLPG